MPIMLLEPYTEIPKPWALASQLQEGRAKRRFTNRELAKLPSRLPRLSVWTAGNLVGAVTASLEPDQPAVDEAAQAEWRAAQAKAAGWLAELEEHCAAGAKLVDHQSGQTVGQIVAPPVKGTNVALAVMRLESVGLLKGGVWSKINKVHLVRGESRSKKFRYLPYLPLWWPELDMETGKAKMTAEGDEADYGDEARGEDEKMPSPKDGDAAPPPPAGYSPIEIEELPLNDEPLQPQEEEGEEPLANSETTSRSSRS